MFGSWKTCQVGDDAACDGLGEESLWGGMRTKFHGWSRISSHNDV